MQQLNRILTKQPEILRENMTSPVTPSTALFSGCQPGKQSSAILGVIKEINSSTALPELLNQLVKTSLRVINGDKALLLLYRKNGQLDVRTSMDSFGNPVENENISIDHDLVNSVLEKNETCCRENYRRKRQFRADGNIISTTISFIFCAPLTNENRIIGFLYGESDRINRFTLDEVKELFEIVSLQGSIALSQSRLKSAYIKSSDERNRLKKSLDTARSKASEAEKIKEEFLAHISHEIRTPLNIIINYNDLIKDELREYISRDTEFYFNAIDIDSRRLIRTVDQILNYAQIRSGNFKLKIEKLDLVNSVIIPVISEFKTDAADKGLKLGLIDKSGNKFVFADLYSMEVVFRNLIDNAVKFTDAGEINVIIENENENIRVYVHDTGRGMSQNFLDKIYSPFTQEEEGFTKSTDGSGIGLSLVKRFLELNGGNLSVYTEKGEGSVFSVKLKNRKPD